jgi:endonuclease YncB( thermonuclease family)
MKPALLLPLLLGFTASASEFTGKVVGVYDGDTITVLRGNNHLNRLINVDMVLAVLGS